MHQGWPKFVQNLWLATEDKGFAALVYDPSELNIKLPDGTPVNFIEETDYTFNDLVKFTYKSPASTVFPLHLRIPAWCGQAEIKINGKLWMQPKGNQVIRLTRKWKKKDVVELRLPMKIQFNRWFNNSVGLERGPLVYALRVEESWKEVKNEKDKAVYGDYLEVYPKTPWNYALWDKVIKGPENNIEMNN